MLCLQVVSAKLQSELKARTVHRLYRKHCHVCKENHWYVRTAPRVLPLQVTANGFFAHHANEPLVVLANCLASDGVRWQCDAEPQARGYLFQGKRFVARQDAWLLSDAKLILDGQASRLPTIGHGLAVYQCDGIERRAVVKLVGNPSPDIEHRGITPVEDRICGACLYAILKYAVGKCEGPPYVREVMDLPPCDDVTECLNTLYGKPKFKECVSWVQFDEPEKVAFVNGTGRLALLRIAKPCTVKVNGKSVELKDRRDYLVIRA